jgi:hypothetical protein
MLLDPFKEKFNLPSLPVEFGDRKGIKHCIVGNKPVDDIGSIVFIYNHPEWLRILFSRFVSGKPDHLIADYTGLHISRTGALNGILHVIFCPGDKESPFPMDEIEQPEEVQVSLVNHVNGSWLYIKIIEDLDIMDRCLGQAYENREVAFEIQQGMHLDTTLVFPECSPWAELQTQAYRAAVKGIDKVVDVKPEVIVVLIHRAGDGHKYLSKICIYAPVAKFIGFGKGVSRNRMPYPAVVQFIGDCFQTVLNITEAIPLGKLGKAHDIEMITASEITNPVVSIVSGNTFIELVFWHHGHKLSKDSFPVIHGGNRYDLAINVDFKSLKFFNLVTYLLLTYYMALSRFKRDTSAIKYILITLPRK